MLRRSLGQGGAAEERRSLIKHDARGGTENAESMQDLERLRDFLERNGAQFASPGNLPKPWSGYFNQKDRQWLIFPSTWRTIHAGHDASGAAKRLAALGVLIPGREGDYQRTCRIPYDKKRSKSFYVVNEKALGVGDAEGADDAQ
jgi:hypothetical protein